MMAIEKLQGSLTTENYQMKDIVRLVSYCNELLTPNIMRY